MEKVNKSQKITITNLSIIIIVLLSICIYSMFIKKDKEEGAIDNGNQQNNAQINGNNNVDSGITVYQNGKNVNLSAINTLKGKHQIEIDGYQTNDYIVISDKLSECEIFPKEYLGGQPDIIKGDKIVAIKVYLFANWRHHEEYNGIDYFVIEFNVKEDDSIRNYMYRGWDVNGEYVIDVLG